MLFLSRDFVITLQTNMIVNILQVTSFVDYTAYLRSSNPNIHLTEHTPTYSHLV